MSTVKNATPLRLNESRSQPLELVFASEQEVKKHCDTHGNLQWVIFEGVVYDVTEY
jgi:cytochrome b involved in lipid metabolism